MPTDVKYISKLNDDGFVELTINELRPPILLNVSNNVQTTIHFDSNELKLYEIYEDYSSVEIEVASTPLILYLLRL